MKKRIVTGLVLLLTLAGLVWLNRPRPAEAAPAVAGMKQPDAATVSPPAAEAESRRVAPVHPAPTAPQSPASAVAPARPLVFGGHGPVAMTEIPAGRLRDELSVLAPAARERALVSLARLEIPVNNSASLHADGDGELYYACFAAAGCGESHDVAEAQDTPGRRMPVTAGAEPTGLFAVSVPVSAPPIRHSKPGSARVIYLDFNGHTVTGTAWNASADAPAAYLCTPYDTDGNAGSFSPVEQAAIVKIWERVAEDYRAFDVNVTTEEPAVFNNQTARVLITKDKDANGVPNPLSATASGVAYLNVFGISNYASTYAVSFVYQGTSGEGRIAAIASHEVGHNMGLSHDGTPADEYYGGHGGGETSWAPIMGSGFRNIVQWSKGEYFDANNFQDDLAIIAGKLGTRADDHANTNAAATPLVANGPGVQGWGVIEGSADADRFSFTTGAGPVSLTVTAHSYPLDSNKGALDVVAELLDAAGNVVAQSNPPDSTVATVAQGVAAGTYYLRVSATGVGTPLASPPSGYTIYGSMGGYSIGGLITEPAGVVAAAVVRHPENQTVLPGNAARFEVVAKGNPAASFQWMQSSNGGATWQLASDPSYDGSLAAVLTVPGTALAMNGYRFRCVVTNSGGSATSNSALLTVQTPPPPSLPSFHANAITGTFGRGIPAGTNQNLTATLSGGSDPITFQWRRNGVDIPGAIGSTYFLQNWQPAEAGVYTLVATNPAGSTVSGVYPQAVTPEGGWQWRNPLPVGNGLTRVSFVNGLFLMGGLRGTLLVSTDGQNWTPRTVPAANNLFSFHHVNGLYVAMGSLGAIFTSPDATVWTPRNSGTVHRDGGSGLQEMTLGNGRLVAVGLEGLTTTSTDGLNWTPGTIGVVEDVTGVAYAFGKFHAVSATGRIYSSADATTWTSVASPYSYLRRIAFGAGKLVAVGNSSEVAISTNGTDWTTASAGTAATLVGINYVNAQFIAVGANGAIRTSPDAVSWTVRSSGGNTSTLQNTAYGNGVYVIPGQSGTSGRALLTSTNGVSWSERISGAGAVGTTLRGIAAGAASVVAVGNAGTVLQSFDGRLWTPRTSLTGNQLNDIGFAANLFVAVGNSGTVITSGDGSNWFPQSVSGAAFNGVNYGNGLWVLAASNSQIFTSASGTGGWTQRYNGGSGSLNKVAFGNGVYVAVGSGGQIVSSGNGTGWTSRSSGTAATLNDVTFGAGTFTAVGVGAVLTSTDGTTWTNRSFTPDTMNSVIYTAGHFLATGPGSTYYTSPDGANWEARFTGTPDTLNDMAFFNGEVLAVGDNSNILAAGAPVVGALPDTEAASRSTVTFVVPVTAAALPVSYQWKKDGTALAGATNLRLTLENVSAAATGDYTLVATNALGSVSTTPARLTVPSAAGRLVNLSIRTNAGAGSETLIVGFVAEGGTEHASLLVRAAGPALIPYGVPGVLADPNLSVHNAVPAVIQSNDDWASPLAATFAQVGAFPWTLGSKDAALALALAPAPYTAHVTGAAGATGVVLAEIYDASTSYAATKPRLVNVSARSQVGTADNIMIAGFVIDGDTAQKVLIRAVGPTLANYGVTGVLADPQLAVFSGQTQSEFNNDWNAPLAATFAAVGAFPLDAASKDAALLVTLAPGVYTAQVTGVGDTTGVVLVEIYAVP